MAADYISSCLDEIALEGLDGITIDALWLRLEDRQPQFPLKLDEKSKAFLWRLISIHKDLAFYELPAARGQLVLTDRFKHTDPSTGIFLEQDHYPEDIYPLEIISDNSVIGSCTTYRTRKDITSEIRTDDLKCQLTLPEMQQRWGRRLAMVASQEARNAALYGPEVDPSLVLPEKHYCILERIGRARRQGELTHGKHSLLIFKEPSKTIFYLRKVLVRHGLITVQPFNQKLTNGTNGAGKCLHLKRFWVEYKPIYLGLLENLTTRLASKLNQTEALTVMRSEMNMRDASFKKLYQFGHKYVKTEMIAHKDFYPDSTREEYMIKMGTKERFVRVLTLKKLYKYSSEAKSDDDEGSEAEDEETKGKTEVWNRVVELPLLHQAYQFARSKGEAGASQTDFRQAFRASKLDGRLMARNLDRLGMVKTILQDQGKQRVQMFVAKEYIAGSTIHRKLQEEKDKIVKLMLPKLEARGSGTPLTGTPSSSRAPSPAPIAGTSDQHAVVKSESMLDLSTLDDSIPLIDADNSSSEKYHFKKRGAHVTYRLLKRANYILKAVQEAKLVDNIYQIQRKIIDDEAAEGYTCRCDKKSLVRLIERLARDGQIKSIKTLIKYGSEEKQLHFLCDPSIQATDQIVTSAIEAAKLRHIAVSKEFSKEIRRGEKTMEPNLEPADVNIPNYGLLRSHLTMDDMQYDSDAGRRYGYKPRMLRLQLIHQLLFYLVHVYDLDEAKLISETVSAIPDYTSGVAESIQDLKVYCDELSWKRFIPPLPKHREYEEGWCLIGDVLLRLPVSIFCQIIRVNFKISGLEELLQHPVYRYLTVGKLPSHMRQQLMIERKYIFSFYSNCISLCLMGLISFGKREWKQKEQIFIHVKRLATLVDSTETDEPFDRRPEEEFEFDDMEDLDNYWFRLQWICLNTPLDAIVINADPIGTNHSHALKIERFNVFLEGYLPEEIRDDGTLPGNKLGAAGLDSTFFAHLRRNWSSQSGNLKAETLISEGKRKLMAEGRNVVKRPRKKRRTQPALDTGRMSPPRPEPSTSRDEDSLWISRKTEPLSSQDEAEKLGMSSPRPPEPSTSQEEKAKTPKLTSFKAATAKLLKEKPVRAAKEKKPDVMVKKVILEGQKPVRGGKGMRRKALEPPREPPEPKRRREAKPPNYKKNDLDAIDRDALKRMTKERVMWTPQEDSLLLLCEVASSILGGIRRDFLVQFTIVRDLMHRNFTSSQDKTSKACQRRIRYIMKNEATIANVNMYRGEALQDKSLVEEFVVGKKYSRAPKKADTLNKVFIDLVERLRHKFKTSAERAPLELPGTLEEVYHRYVLSRPAVSRKSQHKTVTNVKDIHFSVLHNVIHSAMVIQDKSGHANELYHIFSQYPDDLLQAVFNQMRADGIVTKIKAYAVYKDMTGKRTMPGPSVAIGNYQMAQRYTYKWFSRYRKLIFLQAFSLLDKLSAEPANTEPQRKTRDKSAKKEEEKKSSEPGLHQTGMVAMKDEGVYAAITISLMVQRKCLMETIIPDQVIVVESQYMSKQKSKKGQKIKKFVDLEKEYHLGTASDEEEERLIEEAEKEAEKARELERRMGVGARSGGAAPPGATSGVTPGTSTRNKTVAVASTNSSSLDLEWENKKTTSRTSLVLFRSQYANGPISVRMLAPQDHIVINSCSVKLKMIDANSRQNCPEPTQTFKTLHDSSKYHRAWNKDHLWIHPRTCARNLAAVRKLEPPEVDRNAFYHACATKWNFSPHRITRIRDIVDDVSATGGLGITDEAIRKKYGNCRGLDRMLAATTEHHVIRRVGVTQPRYVSHQHLSPWLVHSYKNVKGRKTDTEKKTVPLEPFNFEAADSTEAADSENEEEKLWFNVPPGPQGEALVSERLPRPPADKLRVLSLVRSAILEEKEPGGEVDSSDDPHTASDEQSKLTEEPTSRKEDVPQVQPEKEKYDDESDSNQDDQLVPEIETSEEEESETQDASTVPAPAKIIEKTASESDVPDASPEKITEVEDLAAVQQEGEKRPAADLASSAAPESVQRASAEEVPATVPSATPVPSEPATVPADPALPAKFVFQPRCRVRLPRPASQPHVRPVGAMGPRLRMPAVQVIHPPPPRPAVQVIHPPPPRPIVSTPKQKAVSRTKTRSVQQIQPKAIGTAKSVAEAKATLIAENIAEPQPSTTVQSMVGPNPPTCTESIPEPEPTTIVQSMDGPKPTSATESIPEPEPTSTTESIAKPQPTMTDQSIVGAKQMTATEGRTKQEVASTTEVLVEPKPISSTKSVVKPTPTSTTDTIVKSKPTGATSTKRSDGNYEKEDSSSAVSLATTSSAESAPDTPSTTASVRGSPVTSPTVRYRRMSETMALYTKTGAMAAIANPEENVVTQTPTPQLPARIRKVSISDNASGTAGAKVTRIPSILSTRALPSLESMSSRRVRTVSECSEGKPAEQQGTMLQLLEGITGGAAQTGEEPMEISDAGSGLETVDRGIRIPQGAQTPSRGTMQSSPVVRSHLGRESMVSPRAKSIMDQHASPLQSPLRSPIASTSRSPMSSPIMSPRSYSGHSLSPASQRSPRALTNQAILEMLHEAEPPSKSPISHPVSPRTAKSSAILAALHSPPLYAPLQTSPFTSPTKASQAIPSTMQQDRPFMFSSSNQSLGSPAVQKLTFPEPMASPGIRELLKTPTVQRLKFPQPLPMFTPGPGPQAARPRAPPERTSLSGRRGASVSVSTGKIGQLGGQTICIPTPQPMEVVSETSTSAKGVDTYIEVPVNNLPGFDAVKHIIQKGPQDTVRVKLPAGYKLPAGQGQVRFSIVSEDEARKMGLPVPGTSSSATGIRPQRAASPASYRPPRPAATAAAAAPASTGISHQSTASSLSHPSVGGSLKHQSMAVGLRHPSISGSLSQQSPSMSYPSIAGSLMSSPSVVSSMSRPSMPGSQSQQSMPFTAPQPKAETQSTQPREMTKDNNGDRIPQVDGAGDSDNENPSSSSVPPQSQTPQQQPPPRIKHSSAGRYSTFPKYKGCTPESSFHKLYQSVRLIPRPWRQTDGLVNKPTLKLMLESVLILIMSRPGITEDDVTAQYNPILQPVPVIELLEMLEDIGCVHRLNIVSSHKPTLFSSRVKLTFDEQLGSLKTYIPAVDCVLKLGQFEAQLTSAMSYKMREALEAEHAAAMNPLMSAAMSRTMEAYVEKKMEAMTTRRMEEMEAEEEAAMSPSAGEATEHSDNQ